MREVASRGVRARLLREPLFWASVAAFAGTVVGLSGMLRQVALWDSYTSDPTAQLIADVLGFAGDSLVVLSAAGMVCLLWGALRRTSRGVAVAGLALLAGLLVAEAVAVSVAVYWSMVGPSDGSTVFPIPGVATASLWAVVFLPPAVLFFVALVSLLGREGRIGAVVGTLFVLALPIGVLRLLLFPPDPEGYARPSGEVLMLLFGWYPVGVSLIEAPLWLLLGATFLRRARARFLGEAFRLRERENLRAARRLYEEGLAGGDSSVLDGLVSEDFRDLGRGSRGRLAMERVFSDLWRSYPDLAVSIEEQEAEGDLVRTRLRLSGTDRGGVLWYPPTGRRVAFAADFVDRFSDGRLVEHTGRADTGGLLRQLGLEEGRSARPPEVRG